jgi:hypothetical protein
MFKNSRIPQGHCNKTVFDDFSQRRTNRKDFPYVSNRLLAGLGD